MNDLALLKGAIDDLPVALTILDADGRYRVWNKAIAALLGVEADAVLGKLPTEAFPGTAGEELTTLARRILRRELPQSIDTYPWLIGKVRWVRVTRRPIFDSARAIIGIYAMVENVTDEVELGRVVS